MTKVSTPQGSDFYPSPDVVSTPKFSSKQRGRAQVVVLVGQRSVHGENDMSVSRRHLEDISQTPKFPAPYTTSVHQQSHQSSSLQLPPYHLFGEYKVHRLSLLHPRTQPPQSKE